MLIMVRKFVGKSIALLSVCVGTLGVGGCASIISKSQYPVIIESTPPGASVTIKNKRNHVIHYATTPTIIPLKAGGGCARASYTVLFEKDGYESETKRVRSRVDGWFFGNLAFLPLFCSGVVGIGVDALTGAMWKITPSHLHAQLTPISESAPVLPPPPPTPEPPKDDPPSPPPVEPPKEEPEPQKDEKLGRDPGRPFT